MSYCLEVVKQDLAQSRVAPLQAIDAYLLADGEAMIKVDRFGLTANNITYGVAGDMIGYWQFFPAEANWGGFLSGVQGRSLMRAVLGFQKGRFTTVTSPWGATWWLNLSR